MARAAGLSDPAQLSIKDATVTTGGRSLALAAFMQRYAPQGLEAEGEIKPGKEMEDYSQNAYGACFAEVAVNLDSGEPRLRRMLGVFEAGTQCQDRALAGDRWVDLGAEQRAA